MANNMLKRLVKGSKAAKDFMAKIRSKKATNKKVGEVALTKSGKPRKNLRKDQKDFNQMVDAYKYFVVFENKVVEGNEYKNDAIDAANEYYPKAKVYTASQLKKFGIPNNLSKNKYTLGSTLLINKGENPRKKPTRVIQVDRTKKGTFKKFKTISGVTKTHTDRKSHNVNIKVGSVYKNNVPTGKKMYALINEFAYIYASENKLRQYLIENTNKYVEIDTNYLFDDQYNTVDGFRIYDTMISAIKNDARIGIKQFENSAECCFLKWNGIKPYPRPLPKDIPTNIAKVNPQFKNEYMIGTYSLRVLNQHYALTNSRQSIKFLFHNGDYFLTTGIGYRMRINLSGGYPVSYPIPTDVKNKLFKIMNSI